MKRITKVKTKDANEQRQLMVYHVACTIRSTIFLATLGKHSSQLPEMVLCSDFDEMNTKQQIKFCFDLLLKGESAIDELGE